MEASMINTIRHLLLGLLVVAIFAAVAVAEEADSGAQEYTLRYKFQPGDTLRWEVVHRAKIKTTVSGTTQTAETVSTSIKLWQVKDVKPDGTVTFDHLVESVDMWNKLTGRLEVRYNSKTDDQPPPGYETVAESIGVPLSQITMDNTGQIIDRVRNRDVKSAENEGDITIPLPEEAVAVGHSWSFPHQIDVPLPGGAIKKIKAKQQFTLSDVKTGIATIEVATQILTPIHDPAIEAQLIQRESHGTVRFDIEAGRIVGQQMDLDKRVVGFRGEASSLHYLTRFTEEFLPAKTQTASRQNSAEPKTK